MYVHCYAHALNLAVQDSSKQIELVRNVLNICIEITKVISRSPKGDTMMVKIKELVKYVDEATDQPGTLDKFSSTR